MQHLPTRQLGARTDLEVSEIGMGLWAVAGSEWGPGDDEATLGAIDAALRGGVTFFDTADKYGDGHSEELLGAAMRGRREAFVVATKIGWLGYDEEHGESQYDTVAALVEGVEASLERLQTDHVDVIQCHIDFPEPNTDTFIEGFQRLKAAGLVRAWGVSTSLLSHLEHFNRDGDCDVLQVDYSILNRTAEREILPYCQEQGIGVIVRGALAMGLLADKYGAEDTFPAGDFRRAWVDDRQQHQQYLEDLAVVEQLRGLVGEGQTMAQLALRFARSHPAVRTVIPGARTPEQAEANAAAGRLPLLTDEEGAAIDEIVPPGGGRKIWPA